MSFDTKESVIDELDQYIASDGDLYRLHTAPIRKALAIKKARGVYKHDLAVKAFSHLAEVGAKKYAKDHGGTWHQMFDVPGRVQARQLRLPLAGEAPEAEEGLPCSRPQEGVVESARESQDRLVAGERGLVRFVAGQRRDQGSAGAHQQVLKVAGTDEMHSWLRETYGAPYGRGGATRAHSTMTASGSKTKAQLDRDIAAALGKRRRA